MVQNDCAPGLGPKGAGESSQNTLAKPDKSRSASKSIAGLRDVIEIRRVVEMEAERILLRDCQWGKPGHRAVPQGEVIATDLEPDMVRFLSVRARREQLPNLRAIQATPTASGLAAHSVDRILVVHVWHHLADGGECTRGLAAALRPGARLFVVDFSPTARRGPPASMRVAPEAVIAALEGAGLSARGFADCASRPVHRGGASAALSSSHPSPKHEPMRQPLRESDRLSDSRRATRSRGARVGTRCAGNLANTAARRDLIDSLAR